VPGENDDILTKGLDDIMSRIIFKFSRSFFELSRLFFELSRLFFELSRLFFKISRLFFKISRCFLANKAFDFQVQPEKKRGKPVKNRLQSPLFLIEPA